MVCATASAMKPSAIRLMTITPIRALPIAAGAKNVQLTKLNIVTAAQITPCHQRSSKDSSNSARVNSQNTTTLPVESAMTGACASETGGPMPIAEETACAAEPSAKATASRPATTWRKSR